MEARDCFRRFFGRSHPEPNHVEAGDNLRIGIIGSGVIVQNAHLPSFTADGRCRVTALAARDTAKLERLCAAFDVPRHYVDWRKMLAEEPLDAVSIATPPAFHREITVAALERGLHVLVEKPMATSSEEVEDIIRAAEEADRLVMVQQTFRFSPAIDTCKTLLQSGEVGKIRAVHGVFTLLISDFNWHFDKSLAGGGTWLDLGIHLVDLVRYIFEEDVTDAAAIMRQSRFDSEIDDEAQVMLTLKSGIPVTILLSWNAKPSTGEVAIYGSRGCLRCRFFPKEELELIHHNGKKDLPRIPSRAVHGTPFTHFLDCLTRGQVPITDCRDNKKSLEVIFEAYNSARWLT